MKLKALILSMIISIPLFWGINVLADNLENFLYSLELAKRPELITANFNQKIIDIKIEGIKKTKEKKKELEKLEISARAAISVQINKDDDRELLLFNSSDRVAIASLTKLMTALVSLEIYSFDQLITITKEAVNQEGNSKYGNLEVGEKLTIESLLYIMLLESSNDAAYAMVQPIGYTAFVDLMNSFSNKIGLENTYFINPTGLEPDDPEKVKNYSTAKDLVKLSKYILEKHPEIFEISRNESYKVLKPDGNLHHFIQSGTNKLLGEVPGIIGGKTGWTSSAGGCLLLIIDDLKTDSYYINVILGAEDRFTEMQKIINIIQND